MENTLLNLSARLLNVLPAQFCSLFPAKVVTLAGNLLVAQMKEFTQCY